jgi:hypothetical protein
MEKQSYEGQLSINAMRAVSAICSSQCRVFVNSDDPGSPYYRAWGRFQVPYKLLVSTTNTNKH